MIVFSIWTWNCVCLFVIYVRLFDYKGVERMKRILTKDTLNSCKKYTTVDDGDEDEKEIEVKGRRLHILYERVTNINTYMKSFWCFVFEFFSFLKKKYEKTKPHQAV